MKIEWGKVLTSKTIWLGILMVVSAILEYINGLPAGTSITQGIFGVIAIVIRFLTNDAIIKKS